MPDQLLRLPILLATVCLWQMLGTSELCTGVEMESKHLMKLLMQIHQHNHIGQTRMKYKPKGVHHLQAFMYALSHNLKPSIKD
ncbi:hypothetical protein VNO78_29093 [Psophocarpus tetragonolobus]|uniref:Uncharacterized protein n=1 Tax=Psophocarpus tetragonolobus TaxID=3891 RepID=A0AAN9X0J9_PSOTE